MHWYGVTLKYLVQKYGMLLIMQWACHSCALIPWYVAWEHDDEGVDILILFALTFQHHHIEIHQGFNKPQPSSGQTDFSSLLASVAPKWTRSDPQLGTTYYLLDMVTEGLLPCPFVETSSLCCSMESLNLAYAVPSRKHMTTKLLTAKTAGTLKKSRIY